MSLRMGRTRRPIAPKNPSPKKPGDDTELGSGSEGIVQASVYLKYLVELGEPEYLGYIRRYAHKFEPAAIRLHSLQALNKRSDARTVDIRDAGKIDKKHRSFFSDNFKETHPQFRRGVHIDLARQCKDLSLIHI